MNSMQAARAANDAVQTHVCRDTCPKNSNGYCLTAIQLWSELRRAAMAWNAPASISSNSNTYR